MGISDYLRETEEGVQQAAAAQVSFRDLVDQPRRHRAFIEFAPDMDDNATPAVLKVPESGDLEAAIGIVQQPDHGGPLFDAALQTLALGITQQPEVARELIKLVSDRQLTSEQRLAVVDSLQEMSFSAAAFATARPLYLEALRGLVDDRDRRVRRRALGILSRQKDEYAQRRLLAGLRGEEKALVPAAEAIELLSNDIHAEHYPLLRRLAVEAPSRAARIQAIEALAGDPSSAALLAGILADPSEHTTVRQACATTLQAVAPEDGERHTRAIALSDDEDDKLRATSLSSLAHTGESSSRRDDAELIRKAQQLRESSSSRALKRASTAYLDKYGD